MMNPGEQGNTRLTTTAPHYAAPEPPPSQPSEPLPFDVARTFRTQIPMGGAVFALALAIAIPLALYKGKVVYRAEAILYVSPSVNGNPADDRERDPVHYKSFLQHEIHRLLRNDVLETAVGRLAGQGFSWRSKSESLSETADRLRKLIEVTHLPDTYEIELALEGPDKKGLAETLNTVARIYIDLTTADESAMRAEKIRALKEERDRLDQELDKNTLAQTGFLKTLGTASFGSAAEGPDDRSLVSGREKLAEATRARIEAESQLAAFDAAGPGGAGLPAGEDLLARDTELKVDSGVLRQRLSELRARDLGNRHPARRATEQQIAQLQQELDSAQAAARDRAKARLAAEAARALRVETEMAADIRAREARIPAMAGAIHEATDLNAGIAQLRLRIAAVDQRIGALELDAKGPASVRLFSAAEPPIWPIKGGRRKPLLTALGAALLLAVGAMFAADALTPSIRTTRVLERILGFAPVGMLLNDEEREIDFAHEQLLRLVRGIQRSQRDLGAKTFVLTPVGGKDGGSAVVEKLAAVLWSNGTKVLVVEANALNAYLPEPALEKVLEPGLGDFLVRGSVDWQCIRRPLSGHDRVLLGNTLAKPRLPDVGKLESLLGELAGQYDMVLVSGPPLLMCADAEHLVTVCDATLLLVEAGVATRGEIQKVVERLTYLRPTRIGAILNQVSLRYSDRALRQEAKAYGESVKSRGIRGVCA